MKKIELYSDVKNGQLQMNVRKLIAENLPGFNDKRVKIVIERAKVKRSDNQNRFYWGYIIPSQIDCFKEMWGEIYDAEQLHDWNKANVWYEEKVNDDTGETFKIPSSSTKVSKYEFEQRLEKLRQFFELSFSWKLPYPNENATLELE